MYRLPNGRKTESSREYLLSWEKFAEPLADATNTTPIAFNPGITLTKPDWSRSVQIPTWFVAAFNEGLKEEKGVI